MPAMTIKKIFNFHIFCSRSSLERSIFSVAQNVIKFNYFSWKNIKTWKYVHIHQRHATKINMKIKKLPWRPCFSPARVFQSSKIVSHKKETMKKTLKIQSLIWCAKYWWNNSWFLNWFHQVTTHFMMMLSRNWALHKKCTFVHMRKCKWDNSM